MDILETTNPTWGFFGAFSHHATDPTVAWPLALEAIAKGTGCSAECLKTFLESPKGRTFAEAVIERMSTNPLETIETAVDAAVERWMYFKFTKEDASKYGMPYEADLPYLKGFACHCKLKAETSEG
jgi:hypothetical protein